MKIQIEHHHFTQRFNSREIENRVGEIAEDLKKDIFLENTVFLVVMNGAYMFASELLRHFAQPLTLQFLQATSYQGMAQAEMVDLYSPEPLRFNNRDVIVVEDIVDSGNTLHTIVKQMKNFRSWKVATLLFKPDNYQYTETPHYIGFELPPEFAVGYGLDFNGVGRNLPGVYTLS